MLILFFPPNHFHTGIGFIGGVLLKMYGNQPNYFSVISKLKTSGSTNASIEECRSVFQCALENRPLQNEKQFNGYRGIDSAFRMCNVTKDHPQPDFKTTYDNYIALFRDKNGTETNVTFMRFLSLYIGGYITHRLFIRLIYRLLNKPPKEDPLISNLPAFLASIHFNSFTLPKKKFDSKEEEVAAEVIITVTAAVNNAGAAHSIYKCFKLLSEGYISPVIARKWLSSFCTSETLAELETISDFSAFHPSRIPHEFILCADFCDEISDQRRVNDFNTKPVYTRNHTDYEKVAFETVENQLQATRTLIDLIARGEKPSLERLSPYFGKYASQVAKKLPQYGPIAIKRLVVVHDSILEKYRGFVAKKLSFNRKNYIEYRIAYKNALKNLYDPVHYMVPGARNIHLGNGEEISKAMDLISSFMAVVFGENENLEKGMLLVKEFLSGGIYLTIPPLVNFALSLSELIRITKGFDVSGIPEACKKEDELKKMFPECEQQCVDLVLIKAVRQINKLKELIQFEFKGAIQQGSYVSAVHVEGEDVIVETQLSPFFKI